MVCPLSDRGVTVRPGCALPPTATEQPAATITAASKVGRYKWLLMRSSHPLPLSAAASSR